MVRCRTVPWKLTFDGPVFCVTPAGGVGDESDDGRTVAEWSNVAKQIRPELNYTLALITCQTYRVCAWSYYEQLD